MNHVIQVSKLNNRVTYLFQCWHFNALFFVCLTWRILSPGCSRLDAGPSGWTLVTKIPYKSEVTEVRILWSRTRSTKKLLIHIKYSKNIKKFIPVNLKDYYSILSKAPLSNSTLGKTTSCTKDVHFVFKLYLWVIN